MMNRIGDTFQRAVVHKLFCYRIIY